jgi:hypothetical protein
MKQLETAATTQALEPVERLELLERLKRLEPLKRLGLRAANATLNF